MKKVLCLFVAIVLSSSVAFAQNNSTVDTKSFFDSIIKKKSVSIEFRQYEINKVNDKNEFSGFWGMPQSRLDLKADLFSGVLVGGIYVQTSFMDRDADKNKLPNGMVLASSDVVDFSLTSPYTNFESTYFDAGVTVSWSPALLNKYGAKYESINGKVTSAVKAPSFNLGFASLNLSSAVEVVVHYTPFDKTVRNDVKEFNKKGPKPVGFNLVEGEKDGTVTITGKTDKSDLDLVVTVLDAKLPLNAVKGLVLGLSSEFEANYVASIDVNEDNSKKDIYNVDRETRTTVGVAYALTPNLVVSENVTYTMDGFYKDSRTAKRWTNLVALKYSL